MNRAAPVMEVWPSGFANAGREPKPPQAAPVKSRDGERCGKGPLSAGQVCDEKTNVREPLLTHRWAERRHQNRGSSELPGQRRVLVACPQPGSGLLAALVVPGVEVAWARRGRWRGTGEPVVPIPPAGR